MRPDRLPRILLMADDGPLPRADIDAQVARVVTRGAKDVLIAGPEPTRSPDLLYALGALREQGRRAILVSDARALTTEKRLDHLHRAGLHELAILLPESRAKWAQALQAAEQLIRHQLAGSLATLLRPTLTDQTVRAAARLRLPLRVLRDSGKVATRRPRLDDPRAEAFERLWLAARAQDVRVIPDDLGRCPAPCSPGDPLLLHPTDMDVLGRGVLPDAVMRGARLPPEMLHEAPTLASWGVPLPGLPPCLGGTTQGERRGAACESCLHPCTGVPHGVPLDAVAPRASWQPLPDGPTIHIVMPWLQDELFVVSTLPALAEALRAQGATVHLHHAYDLVWDPERLDPPRDIPGWKRAGWLAWRTLTKRATPVDHYTPPDGKLGHPSWWREPEQRGRAIDEAFLATLEFAGADAIIVPGYRVAATLLDRLPERARLIIADFHMLAGVEGLSEGRIPEGDRASLETWWPHPRVQVHACFSRYARLYRAQGVPLRQVHWRPYPLFLPHIESPTPTSEATYIFSGGRHFRDYETLWEAQPSCRPLHVVADLDLPAKGCLTPLGTTSLPDFVEALRHARFVVLPLHHDLDTCSGLTVLSLAHAAGRPVISTWSGGTVDHIRDGIDGLLVPPGDADALRDAIERLDRDDDLLATLTEGAQAAGRRLSVHTWAREILHGLGSD